MIYIYIYRRIDLNISNISVINRVGLKDIVEGSLSRSMSLLKENMGWESTRYVSDDIKF